MSNHLTHWVDGTEYAGNSGRTGDVTNPATGQVSATVAFADQADAEHVIAAAKAGALEILLAGVSALVLHLMVRTPLLESNRRPGIMPQIISEGTLAFIEAGTKRRASLHYVVGEAALEGFDAGGLEIGDIDLATFTAPLSRTIR
jgi:hypothetical protein